MNQEQRSRRSAIARWVGRGIGTVAAGFWLLVGVLHGLIEPEPFTGESWGIAALIVVAAVAAAVTWWRERSGAILMMAVGIAHSTFAGVVSGRNHLYAMLMTGGPFILSGALLLLARRAERSTATARES